MVTDQTWEDMRKLVGRDSQLNQQLDGYKAFFKELKEVRKEILRDPARKAALKELMAMRPLAGWSMNKIAATFTAHKKIYDYIGGE